MLTKTVFAGFGGQGVLFMGSCLATAAMRADFHSTFLPSYGPEVRGGTANCTVAVSDEPIASPVASEPDFVVVMNNPSALRFQNRVVSGGMIFVNADMIDIAIPRPDVTVTRVPVVTLATQIGNPRGANIVMLGVLIRRTGLLEYDAVAAVIETLFAEKNPKLVPPNLAALRAGYDWTEQGEHHGA